MIFRVEALVENYFGGSMRMEIIIKLILEEGILKVALSLRSKKNEKKIETQSVSE